MPPTLKELRRRPHHSYSSLNTFLNCPLQYAMRYVYKIKPEKIGVALPFGSAFHEALTWLAKQRENDEYSSVDELREMFSESWNRQCEDDKELLDLENGQWDNLNELGRKMVTAFYENWLEDQIIQVAWAFVLPIMDADEEPVSEKPLIGEIDLIVRDANGEVTLVDWKTSARKWSDGKADSHLQATCFCYAQRYLTGNSHPFRFDVVTKTKAPKYETIPTRRTVDHFHHMAELFRMLEKAVKNDVFFPMNGSFMCRDCSYSEACRHWHRKQAGTLSLAA